MGELVELFATWHVLDASGSFLQELTSALSQNVPVLGWIPEFSWVGWFKSGTKATLQSDPPFRAVTFPLQRGYAKAPIRWVRPLNRCVTNKLLRQSLVPRQCPLVCTAPFYAPVAERWPGPVVYYSTDLTMAYNNVTQEDVRRLDRELCAMASAVCPNSRRIAQYLVQESDCPEEKITIIPSATRSANVRRQPPQGPEQLPPDLADLPRPIAGIIGDLSESMDWVLLQQTISQTPWLRWVFVGSALLPVADPRQEKARTALAKTESRIRFTGPKLYGDLQLYARAFDVAVLPYKRKEPTYSGSSSHFYEHLAAARPMLATRGLEELLDKEPMLKLVSGSADLAWNLDELRRKDFADGYESMRWAASHHATWEARAEKLQRALRQRAGARA
jgi:glycosyltransferase involved in cell wall biosynthesis